MQPSPENPSVFFAGPGFVRVSRAELEALKDWVAKPGRARARLCVHPGPEATIHEMFIVLKAGGYVRPHKHSTKTESLEVLEGRADAVFFEDDGRVAETVAMGEWATGLCSFYRLPEPRFHTLLLKTELLVFKETSSGPFERSDTVFPDWAPSEPDSPAGRDFLERLSGRLG